MANPAKVLATIERVDSPAPGIYQVTFGVPSRYTRYQPGQFLHLTLDEFDPTTGYWPESRVFSIASQPRLDSVSIVYSVKGEYTRRMERELAVGRNLWLKFPYGAFVIDESEADTLVLIGGGTGVSPYRPFLLRGEAYSIPVHLYYGIRQPEHLLFRDDWERLLSQPWFHFHLKIENGIEPRLPFQPGRLSIDSVWSDLGERAARAHYYLSGPPAMIQNFKNALTSRGVLPAQVHIDDWE